MASLASSSVGGWIGPGLWVVGCTCLYVCTKPQGEFVYPLMRVRMHVRWGGEERKYKVGFASAIFFPHQNVDGNVDG